MDLSVYFSAEEDALDKVEMRDDKPETVVRVINAYLREARYEGDVCLTLTMPEATLKKYKEKFNSAIWWAYKRFCTGKYSMMTLLVGLETMVDAVKLTDIIDQDIKLMLAKEQGISVTIDDLETAAKNAGKKSEEPKQEPLMPMSQELMDKLTEEDPEEEAEILEGL